MIRKIWQDEEGRGRRLCTAWILALAIAVAHFALGARGSGLRHLSHVALAAAFLLPIVLAATVRGARAGLALGGFSSAAYLAHVALRQGREEAQIVDAIAVVAGFLVVAVVAGRLASEAQRRRKERDVVIRSERRGEARRGLEALLEALSARDADLARHSRTVGKLASLIGRRSGLDSAECDQLYLAGLVHDVGKIGLSDDILFSNGSLSVEQRDRIRSHPERAADMVRAVARDDLLAEIVGAHHECPDGSGYPLGLRSESIPELARLLRVADVFVALTERRSYRDSETVETALSRMRAMSPGEVDSAGLAALGTLIGEGWWRPESPPERGGPE